MILTITDDFDLEKIAESGQCFRWKRLDKTTYRIIKTDQCLYVSSLGDNQYEFDCDDEAFQSFWLPYFDLETNYQSIRERIPEEDVFLQTAMEQEKGIRILRQDSWEMLITSIITQNRTIPAIQRSIELMSEMCGNRKTDDSGNEYYKEYYTEPFWVIDLYDENTRIFYIAAIDCLTGEFLIAKR